MSQPSYLLSPITLAVRIRNVHCINKLIKKGARLNVTGYDKSYAWSMNARLGNVELLACMFNHGIDIDCRDQNGFSILWHVIASDNIEALRYLLDLGVTIPSCEPERYINNHNMLCITQIKQEKRDPCMAAICYNQLEIVKLLERHGSTSCELFTALRRALIYNSEDVTSYLLNKYKYYLNMDYIRESEQSGSMYTLLTEPKYEFSTEITKLLLDHGADPDKQICSTTSANAIMIAIHYRSLQVIAQYIRSGVDVNVWSYDLPYENVLLPFEASVRRGYHNIAEMLLISGCSCGVFSLDNNHKFKNNLTPEVAKLVEEWKVQKNNVVLLKQRCRSVILNNLSPRADTKIDKLPLPRCIVKFLRIPDLDDFVDA